jgi:hypothetical protein
MSSQNPIWTPQPEGFYFQETTFTPSASNSSHASASNTTRVELTENEKQMFHDITHKMSTLVNSMAATKGVFEELNRMVIKAQEDMHRNHFKHGLHLVNNTVVSHMGDKVPTMIGDFTLLHSIIFKILAPNTDHLTDTAVENLKTMENVIFGKQMSSLSAESSEQTSHLVSMSHLRDKMNKQNDSLLRKMQDAQNQFNTLEEQHDKQLATIREQQQNTARLYKNIAGNFMDLFEGHKRVWTDFVGQLESLLKKQEKLDHKALTSLVADHLNKLNTLSMAVSDTS